MSQMTTTHSRSQRWPYAVWATAYANDKFANWLTSQPNRMFRISVRIPIEKIFRRRAFPFECKFTRKFIELETMAMVILALRCIMTDHHHRHLAHFVRRPALRLALLQDFQGNFGSLKSTALACKRSRIWMSFRSHRGAAVPLPNGF